MRSQKKSSITQLSKNAKNRLRKLGVTALYLFGSRAQGVAGPLSDFDFGVMLSNPKLVRESNLELYEQLYDILLKLCRPASLEADVLDIVFLDSPRVPLELKFNIVRLGTIIFEAEPRRRADLEERIMEAYCDFRPMLDMFDRAVLARI